MVQVIGTTEMENTHSVLTLYVMSPISLDISIRGRDATWNSVIYSYLVQSHAVVTIIRLRLTDESSMKSKVPHMLLVIFPSAFNYSSPRQLKLSYVFYSDSSRRSQLRMHLPGELHPHILN